MSTGRPVSPLAVTLASLCAALAGCSQTTEELWLAGDLHVHSSVASNDTDGLGTVDALGPAMQAAGLDFLFLTDHSNSAGSMHCDDVEDCPNLGPETADGDWPEGVVAATEISPIADFPTSSEPNGHVGCLPLDGVAFTTQDAFIDRPAGSVTGASVVQQCRDAGGWAVVNHPFGVSWIQWDWSTDDFDAMEVYNGGSRFAPFDEAAVADWEARGARYVAVGGSDCHRWGIEPPGTTLDPPLGWPVTWVGVRDGEGVMEGLRAGRVTIAEPGTSLSFTGVRGRTTIGPGEHLSDRATLSATASATELNLVLQIKEVGGEVLAEQSVEESEVTVTIDVGPGRYFARVWPVGEIGLGTGGVALTNPVHID